MARARRPGRARHRRVARHRQGDCARAGRRAARCVVGTATTEARRERDQRVPGAAGIAGRGIGAERERRAAVDACVGAIQKEFGAVGDPRQQRRHHARQPAAAHEGRGMGRDHGDRPQVGLPAVARGAARHDEGALRPHHQHHLGGRRRRGNAGQTNYAAAKAGIIGFPQVARARDRQPQHHRQLRRAGIHRHRHDARARRGAAQRAARRTFRSGGSGSREDVAAAVAFLASPAAAYITGARCTSTAACTWIEARHSNPARGSAGWR